jgi:hypothetical protein
MIDPTDATAPEKGSPPDVARRWISELGQSERQQEKYLGRVRKIKDRYRQEKASRARKYALLYSNTQTILPAVYARPPQPVVSRRFKDADPTGRQASEVLERALSYSIDKQDLDAVLKWCSLDFVLAGRGVAWERYVPIRGEAVTPRVPLLQITDDGAACYTTEDGEPYDGEVEADDDGKPTGAGEPFKGVASTSVVSRQPRRQMRPDWLQSVNIGACSRGERAPTRENQFCHGPRRDSLRS